MSGRAACHAASRRSWLAFSSGLLEISDACATAAGLNRMQPDTVSEARNLTKHVVRDLVAALWGLLLPCQ